MLLFTQVNVYMEPDFQLLLEGSAVVLDIPGES